MVDSPPLFHACSGGLGLRFRRQHENNQTRWSTCFVMRLMMAGGFFFHRQGLGTGAGSPIAQARGLLSVREGLAVPFP